MQACQGWTHSPCLPGTGHSLCMHQCIRDTRQYPVPMPQRLIGGTSNGAQANLRTKLRNAMFVLQWQVLQKQVELSLQADQWLSVRGW